MDVAQLGIKINQTNQLQSSLSLKTKQKEVPILSFNQVLASAALGSQTADQGLPNIGKSSPTVLLMTDNTLGTASLEENIQNPSTNLPIGTALEQSSPSEVKTEDLNELFSLLSSLMAVLQQDQITSIDDGNSQNSKVDGIHNSAELTAVSGQVNPENILNPMKSVADQILVDPEALQISPEKASINDSMAARDIPEKQVQIDISTASDISSIGLKKNMSFVLPIQSIGKENLRFIQPVVKPAQTAQSEQLELETETPIQVTLPTTDDQDVNNLIEKKIDAFPLKQAVQDIQMKLANMLTVVNPKTGSEELKDDGSFLQDLTSLLDDLQVLNSPALPDKVNELVRKLYTSVDQLQSNLSSSMAKIGSKPDTNTNNSANLALNFDVNNILFTPPYQEKQLPERNLLRNGIYSPQNEFLKLDGQGLVLNQPLNHLNQMGNENDVETIPILPVNDFVPEIDEFVGRFVKLNKSEFGSTEAKFSLFPENLGHVGVKILTHDGQITALIMTETPAAKQALEGQLHQLRQALLEQGLIVQKLDIIQQPTPSNSNQGDLSFSQGNSGFSREQRSYNKEENDLKKQNSLEKLEIDNDIQPIPYQGAASKGISNIDFTA